MTSMQRIRRRPTLALALAVIFSLGWIGCTQMFRLPPLEGRSPSSGLSATADTALGRAVAPQVAAHPGQSGIFPLADGHDAFAARLLLVRAAERTLDVQYYIWHRDLSGTLLFAALYQAAERGVRVRLLLDDNNTAGLDDTLAALDAHPNIEVRLFNPFVVRRWRALAYLTDFPRLNRRMHNKSLTADNQLTIVGGRNIGDEYFGTGDHALFVDLDALAVGPVAHDVSRDFARYWASESAYPVDRLLRPVGPAAGAELLRAAETVSRQADAIPYLDAVAQRPLVRELIEHRLALIWAPTRLISDDPAKGLGRATEDNLIGVRLKEALGAPQTELTLVSPYFVPTRTGVATLGALARQGVKVRVLTNSLAATDVAIVHAGYAKHRAALLAAGIELRELKPGFGSFGGRDHGLTGSSGSSLHAKTFAVDHARAFIGSFNFDPRSARLNTESGLVIESPALAGAIADAIAADPTGHAYRLRLDDRGRILWLEQSGGREIVHQAEPGAGFWRRASIRFYSWLPIEWLL
jgi:putative cardiolipin synthase